MRDSLYLSGLFRNKRNIIVAAHKIRAFTKDQKILTLIDSIENSAESIKKAPYRPTRTNLKSGRDRRAKERSKTRPLATNHCQAWTSQQSDEVMSSDKTDEEIAIGMGRTISAVRLHRHGLKAARLDK